MKHIYLLLFMLIPMTGMAQEGISQDTTLYVNGRKILIKENEGKIKVKLYEQSSHGDTIENDQIFEGIYTDGQTTERRTAFTVPFVKRKNHYRFDPHIAGFYMGHNNRFRLGIPLFPPGQQLCLQTNRWSHRHCSGCSRRGSVYQKPVTLFLLPHSGSPGMAKKIQPQQCSRSSILFSRT